MVSSFPLRPLQRIASFSQVKACYIIPTSQFGEQEEMCRTIEEAFLIFAVPGSWFYLMFFCGAIKLTGPFVTMIFKMVTGDMFTFSIVYSICLLGFSQAFFFIIKSHEDASLYAEYHTTWVGLFHMTLGDYDYGMLGTTPYPKMAKVVFVIFQVSCKGLLVDS